MHPSIGEIKWKIDRTKQLNNSFTNSCEMACRLQTANVSDQTILTIINSKSKKQTMKKQINETIKNIVLVHGAFADGSGWEAVYNILAKKGYNVSVVANPNTSLADDVAATKLELETKGIFVEPIRVDELTGKHFTFFQDPDGLPLELYER